MWIEWPSQKSSIVLVVQVEQVEQSAKFRKLHNFTVTQPLKPGKAYHNTMISKLEDDIKNLISYKNLDIISTYAQSRFKVLLT